MKKYIYLVVALLAGTFSACDYNEHYFDDFDEKTRPENVAQYEYTFQDADVATIVSGLKANKNRQDSLLADAFSKSKVFSKNMPAATLIPYLLKSKYYTVDLASKASVTYKYDELRDSVVTGLSTKAHTFDDADYKIVWGTPFAKAFTPNKAPEKNIPAVLKERFKDAKKGEFKNVAYEYSTKEPIDATVEGKTLWSDDFEGQYAAYDVINKKGWQSQDLKGTYNWQAKTFDNSFFAEVSSYKSKGDNELWLVSPTLDLSAISNPHFSFDICVRNPAGDNLLTVWVSKDFDGTNIEKAKWTNVTKSFTIPTPTTSMNDFENAGMGSLESFAGEKVHVAFKYVGNGVTGKTTTYRIDNVKVFEAIPGIEVEKSETVYASYEFDGSAWKVTTDKISLQPADYTAMGVSSLSVDNAPSYISKYLNSKYPYAVDGKKYVVIYKTSSSNQADEYIYSDATGKWTPNTFVVEKTDQFVFANVDGVKQWIFDPTISRLMDKADYQIIVDYVKANEATTNAELWDTRGNAEYYYGFSAYYPNVSYRDKDRSKDPLYPVAGTDEAKEEFCNARTIKGIQIFLAAKYPDAKPMISGVTQMAKIELKIYSSHITKRDNEMWVYTFECTGDKTWKFIQRESQFGTIEVAK